MNKTIKVYADIDTFFDMRRGIIQWLATEGITDDVLRKREGDRLWDTYCAKSYLERRMDTMEFPGINVTQAKFKEAWANRSIENFLMAYPSNASKTMLKNILELEQLTDKPLAIKGVDLYVNTWPYNFDKELSDSFVAHCTTLFGNRFNVKALDINVLGAEPNFYKQFDYVFKYDILSEDYKKFQTSLIQQPIPDVTFLVPDVLVKESDFFKGSVSDRIFAYSVTVATSVKLIPISHDFYDYTK